MRRYEYLQHPLEDSRRTPLIPSCPQIAQISQNGWQNLRKGPKGLPTAGCPAGDTVSSRCDLRTTRRRIKPTPEGLTNRFAVRIPHPY